MGLDRIHTSLGNKTAVGSREVRGSTCLLLRCGYPIAFTSRHLALRGRRRRCSRRWSRRGRALQAGQLLPGSRTRCLHVHIHLCNPLPTLLPRTGAGGTRCGTLFGVHWRCRGTQRLGHCGGLRRSFRWRGMAARQCRRRCWEREPCRWSRGRRGLGGARGGAPGARALALKSTLARGEA